MRRSGERRNPDKNDGSGESPTNRKLREDPDFPALQEKRPEGYWMSIAMAIGVALGFPLGLPIGLAMDNIAIGTGLGAAMGVAIGVAIGAALEQRHKGEIRPLTSYEKRARQWTTWGGIALLALLSAAGVAGLVGMLLR
jgi:hypothetical protein